MLSFSLSFIMTVSAYTKKKQAIVFGRRIKNSTRVAKIKPCFVCVSSGRKYVWDRILSNRYSKYYRKQVSCDGLSDK
jgi:hypothetical protein